MFITVGLAAKLVINIKLEPEPPIQVKSCLTSVIVCFQVDNPLRRLAGLIPNKGTDPVKLVLIT